MYSNNNLGDYDSTHSGVLRKHYLIHYKVFLQRKAYYNHKEFISKELFPNVCVCTKYVISVIVTKNYGYQQRTKSKQTTITLST